MNAQHHGAGDGSSSSRPPQGAARHVIQPGRLGQRPVAVWRRAWIFGVLLLFTAACGTELVPSVEQPESGTPRRSSQALPPGAPGPTPAPPQTSVPAGPRGGLLVAPTLAGSQFVFATKYRVTTGSRVDEHLTLGHYSLEAAGALRAEYLLYDGLRNSQPTAASKRHNPMNAPYGGGCQPGPVYLPTPVDTKTLNGTWRVEGSTLFVQLGTVVREWHLEDPVLGFYRLSKPYYDAATRRPVVENAAYSDTLGFGYVGRGVISTERMARARLLDSYEGEFYQNAEVATSAWKYYATRLSVGRMTAPLDPDVWSLSYACPYEGKRGRREVWCQSTLLLNASPRTSSMLYVNGGHDYNENGCMDERDHTLAILGVVDDDGRMRRMAAIEYSYEPDGYPILGVGRYYQRVAGGPSVRVVSPNGGERWRVGGTYAVTWQSAGTQPSFVGRVVLFKGPFLLFDLAPSGARLPSSGSISWRVPDQIQVGTDFRIQVMLYGDFPEGSRPVAADMSDAAFTVER
jgi:hypothetical protein